MTQRNVGYEYSANETVLFRLKLTIMIGCATFNVHIEPHLTLALCLRLLESCAQAARPTPYQIFLLQFRPHTHGGMSDFSSCFRATRISR